MPTSMQCPNFAARISGHLQAANMTPHLGAPGTGVRRTNTVVIGEVAHGAILVAPTSERPALNRGERVICDFRCHLP